MAQSTARGQITITDLNDARSANMFLSSNKALTQVYSAPNYTPDFAGSSPLVITPELYVSGESGNLAASMTAVAWTINGVASASFSGASVNASTHALTINRNMTDAEQWHIICEGTWTDNGLATKVKADITFAKVINSGTLSFAQIMGRSVITDPSQNITLTAQLIRGGEADPDTSNVQYTWERLNSSSEWEQVGTVQTDTANTITVKAADVTDIASYRVKIKDTDASSGTYGKVFTSCEFDIVDMTDPYSIRMDTSNGTVLVNGQGSTVITATVLRGGEEVERNSSWRYAWSGRTMKDGAMAAIDQATIDAAHPKDKSNNAIPYQLTVDKALVTRKATFICTVTF